MEISLLTPLHNRQILVVGDAMLDKYWFGDSHRISPEAPVPIIRIEHSEERLGGAANVARNIAAMGAGVSLLTALGDDESGKHLEALLHHSSIRPLLHFDPKLETTVKLRIVARQQQMLRADFESMPQEEVLLAHLDTFRREIASHDAVILSDRPEEDPLRPPAPFDKTLLR